MLHPALKLPSWIFRNWHFISFAGNPKNSTLWPLSPRVAPISPFSRRLIKSYFSFVSPPFCSHGQHYTWSTLWNWPQILDWVVLRRGPKLPPVLLPSDNCRILVHYLYLVFLNVECHCLCCFMVIKNLCQCFGSLTNKLGRPVGLGKSIANLKQ